ncbi:MAG: hypothetical protein HYZ17_02945 [Betaproteobacteria bacterium]|nr:hypothetical protein [Betaproteobacteria bacterium]
MNDDDHQPSEMIMTAKAKLTYTQTAIIKAAAARADGGLEIIWRDQGWQELAGELMPGTIAAELQAWERKEVEA